MRKKPKISAPVQVMSVEDRAEALGRLELTTRWMSQTTDYKSSSMLQSLVSRNNKFLKKMKYSA